jgi:inhibitor of KinA sporulation pathway (predicted exonuclease)
VGLSEANFRENVVARLLDEIVVVDVEATCWEGDPPAGETNEIIEIGVCLLNVRTGDRTRREGILVRPERSTVSEFCTRLTTLTQERVEGGISLRRACEQLENEYRSKERVWASYGDYDRKQFERQCAAESLPYPFGSTHLNVKSLLGAMLPLHRELGMARALAKLKLPLEGTHHRGVDDAWNIAAILWEILRRGRQESGGEKQA